MVNYHLLPDICITPFTQIDFYAMTFHSLTFMTFHEDRYGSERICFNKMLEKATKYKGLNILCKHNNIRNAFTQDAFKIYYL